MTKFKEKTEALRLRGLGYSYSQIKKAVKVSKSTLSVWLEKYPLSDARIRELRDWSAERIEHYIATRKRNRENFLKKIYGLERTKILPFSEKESAFSMLTYKRGFGHGTCNVILCDSATAKRVFMGLQVIRDFFSATYSSKGPVA
ncbi:MAG: hypothetical protein UX81_C0007G0015 [Parcubacteria group bacterium GW2011_GWA2_47_12]|uniref:Uncharacterized protein n=1 Tax=Candidatus Giovannonibacteria bacterium RIFCSPLOWO2_01_FULL_44_16 TaxID=1798348 RepID=A0A1F5X0H8_9BACT|nr:MAG: hypothetical protein UX81_C0007G0015 [Parcubacteria group bacterium GW2011_GWA2_47_12]OGF81389.1 MAG: hypothetical protein A2924_03250 [Candidatus Giovannonibacteria bacterium RIFCSPLOWO2_01_FULL_44_16]